MVWYLFRMQKWFLIFILSDFSVHVEDPIVFHDLKTAGKQSQRMKRTTCLTELCKNLLLVIWIFQKYIYEIL